MKRIFTFVGLIFLANFSIGQPKEKKNELSVSTLKISSFPFQNWLYDQPSIINTGITLIYKRKIYDYLAIRGSQSYFKYSYFNLFYDYNDTRTIKEYFTSVGLEFRYYQTKNKKMAFYSGLDLTGYQNASTYSNYFGSSNTISNKGLGLQPFAGIGWHPNKKLVFSLETSFLGSINKSSQLLNNSAFGIQEQQSNNSVGLNLFAQVFPIRLISIGYKF